MVACAFSVLIQSANDEGSSGDRFPSLSTQDLMENLVSQTWDLFQQKFKDNRGNFLDYLQWEGSMGILNIPIQECMEILVREMSAENQSDFKDRNWNFLSYQKWWGVHVDNDGTVYRIDGKLHYSVLFSLNTMRFCTITVHGNEIQYT